ncbi:hypothetical protein ACFX2H_019280 [Malus domestica]
MAYVNYLHSEAERLLSNLGRASPQSSETSGQVDWYCKVPTLGTTTLGARANGPCLSLVCAGLSQKIWWQESRKYSKGISNNLILGHKNFVPEGYRITPADEDVTPPKQTIDEDEEVAGL